MPGISTDVCPIDLSRLDRADVIRGGYPESARLPPQRAVRWFENYVARLADHDARESGQVFDLYHFRDHDGLEVDLLLELRDGRLVAMEVKSGQTITPKTWAGLERFRQRCPDRNVTGVVMHGGTESAALHVLPITALWQHP